MYFGDTKQVLILIEEIHNILQHRPYKIRTTHIPMSEPRIDSQQITQFFYEDDSLLQLESIFPEEEFREMARQLHIDAHNRQSIAYKFYSKKQQRPVEQYQNVNKYYLEYLSWKEKPEKAQSKPSNNQNPMENKKQAKIDRIVDKELQYQKYRAEIQKRQHERLQQEIKIKMSSIQQEYKSKLGSILAVKQKQPQSQQLESMQVRKGRDLGFKKVDYPILKTLDIESQQAKLRKRQQEKIKEIDQQSFVNLIKKPPRKQHSPEQEIPTPIQQPMIQKQLTKNMAQKSWKLDIPSMLQLPYHKFLVFFEHYQHKIAALATPDELAQLHRYRKQALERREAVDKLREKVGRMGPQIVGRLSDEKRERLFRVLYEDQVEEQRTAYASQ